MSAVDWSVILLCAAFGAAGIVVGCFLGALVVRRAVEAGINRAIRLQRSDRRDRFMQEIKQAKRATEKENTP